MQHTQSVLKIKKKLPHQALGRKWSPFFNSQSGTGSNYGFYDAQFCMHIFTPCVCACICAHPKLFKLTQDTNLVISLWFCENLTSFGGLMRSWRKFDGRTNGQTYEQTSTQSSNCTTHAEHQPKPKLGMAIGYALFCTSCTLSVLYSLLYSSL